MAVNQGQQNTFEPPIWKRKEINVSTLDRMYLSNSPNSNNYITNITGLEVPTYSISNIDINSFTILWNAMSVYSPLFFLQAQNESGAFVSQIRSPQLITTEMFLTNNTIIPLGLFKLDTIKNIMSPIYFGVEFKLKDVSHFISSAPANNSIVDLWYNEIPVLYDDTLEKFYYSITFSSPDNFKNGFRQLGYRWHLGRFQFLFANTNDNSYNFKCIEHINKIYFRR